MVVAPVIRGQSAGSSGAAQGSRLYHEGLSCPSSWMGFLRITECAIAPLCSDILVVFSIYASVNLKENSIIQHLYSHLFHDLSLWERILLHILLAP